MKIKGEEFLFSIIKKIDTFLAERKFVREVVRNINKELSYKQVREIWEDELVKVHGDMTKLQYYFSCINDVLEFKETDCVLDIGCGDGAIDSYINVNKLYGIDISQNKLTEAKKRNPKYVYQKQSFLDKISFIDDKINKCFSYGVVQYCKPEDVNKLIENSIDSILKNLEGGGKMKIGHIEVPDIDKAYIFYQNIYGINESVFNKYKNDIRTIFSDGSYWHNMGTMKKKCIGYLKEKGLLEKSIVYLSDSNCYYRTNLVILIDI